MKQKDTPWNFFDEDGNKKIARCQDCLTIVSCKVEKLKAHRQQCHSAVEVLPTVASSTSNKIHVESSIKTPINKQGCNVVGIVTDNEKKTQVTKPNFKEKDTQLVRYGCSAHWLNLLGQNITPSKVI